MVKLAITMTALVLAIIGMTPGAAAEPTGVYAELPGVKLRGRD